MIILKVAKDQRFNTLFRTYIFRKFTGGSQIEFPSCFRVKEDINHAETPIQNTKMSFHYHKTFSNISTFYRFFNLTNLFWELYEQCFKKNVYLSPLHIFSKVYLKVLVKQHALVQCNPWYLFGFFMINLSSCFNAAQSNAGCNLLRWKQVFYYHITFLFLVHSKNQTMPLKNCLQIAVITCKIFI